MMKVYLVLREVKFNMRWVVAGSRESLGAHYTEHLGSNEEMKQLPW